MLAHRASKVVGRDSVSYVTPRRYRDRHDHRHRPDTAPSGLRRRRGAARRRPRRGHLRRRGPAGARAAPPRDRARRALAQRRRRGGRRARASSSRASSSTQIVLLIRMLTRWFQLMNLAEDNDRVRRIRKLDAQPGPRRGSLHAAVAQLAADGTSAEELHDDARRRRGAPRPHRPPDRGPAPHDGQQARAHLRAAARARRAPPRRTASSEQIRRQIAAAVQEMWGSDELRAVSTTVLDEVRAGLIYFSSTLAEVVPEVYRDLEATIRETLPRRRRRRCRRC